MQLSCKVIGTKKTHRFNIIYFIYRLQIALPARWFQMQKTGGLLHW